MHVTIWSICRDFFILSIRINSIANIISQYYSSEVNNTITSSHRHEGLTVVSLLKSNDNTINIIENNAILEQNKILGTTLRHLNASAGNG